MNQYFVVERVGMIVLYLSIHYIYLPIQPPLGALSNPEGHDPEAKINIFLLMNLNIFQHI
jgi:hypothetical protein